MLYNISRNIFLEVIIYNNTSRTIILDIEILSRVGGNRGIKMFDKSLHFVLVTPFGLGSIMTLLFFWLTPMPVAGRVIVTFSGALGVIWAWMLH